MFGGMGGLGGALELDILLRAQDAATGVIEGVGAALEAVIGTTANFQTTLTQVQNNTTMTARDVDTMRAAVLNLNAQTGTPLNDLSEGFRHITSLGFDAADAVKILTEANKSALSTGSSTADVANILALEMHDFGISVGHTAEAMNVLHLASAESNATLEQFTTGTARAATMAANLGIPLQQVDAALAALSRHESLADANTQIVGFLSKLVNPSQQAITELTHLSQVTGIDLVRDFTQAGMSAKGFPAVLDDLRRATGGNVTEMFRLIPALRGGMAEMLLLGTGSKDYKDILAQLNAAMAGQTDPTMQAFTRTMGTFNQEMKVLQAGWNQFMLDIGTPILDTLTPYLNNLISWIQTHKPEIEAFGKLIGQTIGEDVTKFVKAVPGIFDAVSGEVGKFGTLTDSVKSFFDTLGTDIRKMEAGIVGALFDLSKSIEHSITAPVNAIRERLGMGDAPDPYSDMAALAQQKVDFLHSLGLAPSDLMPGGGGSGYTPPINPLTGKPYQGGGGMDFYNPETGKYQSTPYVPGGGDGGGGGKKGGGDGTGADAPGYLDAQQAIAAATRHLRDAQDIFGIDLAKHRTDLGNAAVHALLTADISRVVADMVPVLGYNALDRQLAQVNYLAQIADHTKAAATHLAAGQAVNPLLGFRLPQEAAFGGNIISFQTEQQVTNQEALRQALRREAAQAETIASLNAQLAATEELLAAVREGNTHQAATAHATHETAVRSRQPGRSPDATLRLYGTQMGMR